MNMQTCSGDVLHGGKHGGRATKKNLAPVILEGLAEMLLDHLLGDEADTLGPSRGRIVEDVIDLETTVGGGDLLIELLLEEDVGLGDVCVDEGHSRLVLQVLERGANDLEHRGDASATSNHGEVRSEVRRVDHLALGSLDFDLVANFKTLEVLGNVALLVRLTKGQLCC